MYCSKCGTELSENSVFCSNCGTQKAESDNSQSGNQTNDSSQQFFAQNSDENKNKNGWEYFTGALKKYATFKGRARRAEYWYFTLFYLIFVVVSQIIDVGLLGYAIEDYGPAYIILALALFLPSLAVMVRRYHDIDKSAWHFLIPIYGFILLFYDGTPGPNRFGEDPKNR